MRLMVPSEDPPAPRRVFSPEAVFLVTDILSDRAARHATFGLESVLSTRFPAAVKTGTSKDMRDNWCIGYSPSFTVGVWVGNFSGEPMWDVSGLSGAAPLWLDVMNWLHRDGAQPPPGPPGGVLQAEAETTAGRRLEWFIRGTEPAPVAGQAPVCARIVYPPASAVFAIDPDIPADRQRIPFTARGNLDGLRWVLDGRPMAAAGRPASWPPSPGAHRLELSDRDGAVLDAVGFRVRGRLEDPGSIE
jgi:penicillin-binding protein 1C